MKVFIKIVLTVLCVTVFISINSFIANSDLEGFKAIHIKTAVHGNFRKKQEII